MGKKTPARGSDHLAEVAERYRMRMLIERRMLDGLTNASALAVSLGVSESTIRLHMKAIRQSWKEDEPEEFELDRIARVRQFESLANRSLLEFEKSKSASEDFTRNERPCYKCNGTGTDLEHKTKEPEECEICAGQGIEEHLPNKYKRCEACRGSGSVVEGPKCKECFGKGRITIETTHVKGQVGDPAFLAVAGTMFKEAAKLKGLYPKQSGTAMTFEQKNQITLVGGSLGAEMQNMFLQAPDDLIIQAMSVMDRINHSIKKGESEKVVIETGLVNHTLMEEVVSEDEGESEGG